MTARLTIMNAEATQKFKNTRMKRLRIRKPCVAVSEMTNAANPFSVFDMGSQFATKTTNVIIDGAIRNTHRAPQHLLRQFITRDAFSASAHEDQQNVKLR